MGDIQDVSRAGDYSLLIPNDQETILERTEQRGFMTTTKPEHQTLKHTLSFLSIDGENRVLDALSCYLHNEGYSLQGNTAESDEMWLARLILKERVQRHADNWEQATVWSAKRRYTWRGSQSGVSPH
jgi:hypothetical protein